MSNEHWRTLRAVVEIRVSIDTGLISEDIVSVIEDLIGDTIEVICKNKFSQESIGKTRVKTYARVRAAEKRRLAEMDTR